MQTKKLLYFSLFVFLISLSIYRVDLSLGFLPFKITPILISALYLILLFLFFFLRTNKIKIRKFNFLIVYISLILSVIQFSFIINIIRMSEIEYLQILRFILFSVVLVSSVIFIYLFDKLSNFYKYTLISKFINISLFIYIFFSILEVYYFFNGKYFLMENNTVLHGLIYPYPHTIGPYFPRITGGFVDPNISSYFLTSIFFLSILLNKSKAKIISFLLIILTFSRSGIFGLLLGSIVYKLFTILYNYKIYKRFNIYLYFKSFIKKIILYMFILFLFFVLLQITLNIILQILTVRFNEDLKEGSGAIHLKLIFYALSKLNDDFVSILIGYGFNSSYIFSQIFFPGNKYANFHSEYITFLFEEGIIGLLSYLLIYYIIIYHLMLKSKCLNIKTKVIIFSSLISLASFNIFYQQFIFNYYWVYLFIMYYILKIKCNNFIILIQNKGTRK